MNNAIILGTGDVLLYAALIKTTKRITFEIIKQHERVTNIDPNKMILFKASNGYEIISEHRLDIQSRRVWLKGASNDAPSIRSGTMAVPTQQMTDEIFPEYIDAFKEWAEHNKGKVVLDIIVY